MRLVATQKQGALLYSFLVQPLLAPLYPSALPTTVHSLSSCSKDPLLESVRGHWTSWEPSAAWMAAALPRAGRNSSKHHHIWSACETICFPVFHSFLITVALPPAFPFSATGTCYRLAVWADSVLMQEVPVSKLPPLFPDTLKESNTHGQQSDFIRVPASPRKPGLAGKGNLGLETGDSTEALALPPAFYGLVSSSVNWDN